MSPRQLHISDYDYPLPPEKIARYPIAERDQSKLLVYRKGNITHRTFSDIPQLLPADTPLIYNNTKVIQARLRFRKETGALIEIFCLEPYSPRDSEQNFRQTHSCEWLCLVGNKKKWHGETLTTPLLSATLIGQHGDSYIVRFEWDNTHSFSSLLEAMGELPIPPYLNRATEESDLNTYQTVYSKIDGSVAAPTAGLHFTDRVLRAIDERGIERDEVTLHVGAGTFRPVATATIGEHVMHSETIIVRQSFLENLLRHLGGDIIPVGTTSTRTLESLYWIGMMLYEKGLELRELHLDQWYPYDTHPSLSAQESIHKIIEYLKLHELTQLEASTSLMIAPGYKMRIINGLITNFHQPKSTLLLLVSALIGDKWKDAYQFALEKNFRFLSYGDSCLFF